MQPPAVLMTASTAQQTLKGILVVERTRTFQPLPHGDPSEMNGSRPLPIGRMKRPSAAAPLPHDPDMKIGPSGVAASGNPLRPEKPALECRRLTGKPDLDRGAGGPATARGALGDRAHTRGLLPPAGGLGTRAAAWVHERRLGCTSGSLGSRAFSALGISLGCPLPPTSPHPSSPTGASCRPTRAASPPDSAAGRTGGRCRAPVPTAT